MKIKNYTAHLAGLALILFTGLANATVARPALDIQDFPGEGDTGASLTASVFNIDATAFTIVTTGAPIDIPDQMFSLTSSGAYDGISGVFGGTFVVDGGLLSGSFSSLDVVTNVATGRTLFLGDVTYTGGSLAGSLAGGRLEGRFNTIDGSALVAKLGPVVPIPAAVWLFGSGLIGLVALARRKTT